MAARRSSVGGSPHASKRRPSAGSKRAGARKPRKAARTRSGTRRWSARVMQTSDALDLEQGVFTKSDPRAIARSLKRSAETSRRRKSSAFRSAMSMLNFDINRAGKNLPAARKRVLERAKDELRGLFHRQPGAGTSRRKAPQRERRS